MPEEQAAPAHIFLAISMGYWGRGTDVSTAKKAMYKAGARRGCSYYVELMPAGTKAAWLDDNGYICWNGNPDGERIRVDSFKKRGD